MHPHQGFFIGYFFQILTDASGDWSFKLLGKCSQLEIGMDAPIIGLLGDSSKRR